jgi:hypothetical protein
MSGSNPEAEVVEIGIRANTEEGEQGRKRKAVQVPQNQLEIWDREAERRGMNRSEIIRVYAAAGRKMLDEYEPESSIDQTHSPLRDAIVEHVPVGEDEASSIDEITEKVINQIEDEVWDVLIEEESISRSGNRFYQQ